MRASISLILCLLGSTAHAQSMSTVLLPSRGAGAERARERLGRIGSLTAARLGKTLAPMTSPLTLHDALERARKLSVAGAIDEAATVFDRAIADGAHAPERIDDLAGFVSAHLRRASIAIARGETATAHKLLARIYRYDPTFALSPLESTPPLAAALDELARTLGTNPTLEPADIGDCGKYDVLLVARTHAGDTLDLLRYDRCRLTANTLVGPDTTDDAAAAALAVSVAASAREPAMGARPRSRSRALLIAGAATVALGVALIAPGIYFAADASSRASAVTRDCTMAAPCTNAQYAAFNDDYDRSRIVASVLVPLGAVALIAGVTCLVLDARAPLSSGLRF